jgi:hypothetical protein
MVLKNDK